MYFKKKKIPLIDFLLTNRIDILKLAELITSGLVIYLLYCSCVLSEKNNITKKFSQFFSDNYSRHTEKLKSSQFMEETDLNASMIESSTGTESSHGTEPSKETESSINEDDEPIIVGKGRNIIRSKNQIVFLLEITNQLFLVMLLQNKNKRK